MQTQELPSLLVPLLLLMFSKPAPVLQQLDPRSALLYAFLAHYAYRSLVYPLLIRGGKGTALAVWAMAAAFCAWNGFLQVMDRLSMNNLSMDSCATVSDAAAGILLPGMLQ